MTRIIRNKQYLALVTALGVSLLAACDSRKFDVSDNTATQLVPALEQAPCADSNPVNNAYFGDFHVHTGYSADAWKFGVRTTPQDAYRYAFGEEIMLPPNDPADTTGTRSVSIDRPLDFMGVTDHAEFFGENIMCIDSSYPEYQTEYCVSYRKAYGRDFKQAMALLLPFTWRDSICGEGGERCRIASQAVWKDTIQAAEDWDDASADCERSTFVAYEYSSVRLGSNLHRNVVFRNTTVPPLPISTIEAPRHWQLWEALQRDCLDSGTGCDVLAIPHNSNISNGRMFAIDYPGTDGVEEQRARAILRMKLEPIIEVMQHKGDSECRNDLPGVIAAVDELCEFEKFENFAFQSTNIFGGEIGECDDFGADNDINIGPSCISRLSYARSTLVEGLKEEARMGVNPFKFGLSAATDTHNGIAGGVEERSFPGHLGTSDDTPEERTIWSKEVAGNASNNPGGLIGVWAPENSRDAIFEAMQRKEVFGTSGPRIQPRLFAGYDLDAELCSDPELLSKAYEQGVPMGGDIAGDGSGNSPRFLVTAVADSGVDSSGTPLQRLQIIKGWVDADGMTNEQVFDVAGDPDNGAGVNLDTCERTGEGFAQLCGVWEDPEFDPQQSAVYYMRAVENPSCRYTAWQCVDMPADQRPDHCRDERTRTAIQERAWTSPVWYSPRKP